MTAPELLMIAANVAIMLGYLFVAFFVAPGFEVSGRTKIGAIGFFLGCGLTHMELAIHTGSGDGYSASDLVSVHSLLIHVPQAICVWLFITGLIGARLVVPEHAKSPTR